jgi:GDP-4-dehydro-6-deoxy-D-mannose reductase
MPEILITGAKGFIGSHLVRSLGSRRSVLAMSRAQGSVEDSSSWTSLAKTDVVIHLAGRSYVPASWNRPAEFMQVNLSGTLQALEYCRAHGARMIFASSYLYGAPDSNPVPETAPLRTPNPYAFSKRLAEEACAFYAETFGIPVIILRPFNIYGPGQGSDFLIPSIVAQALGGGSITVKDLEPKRDYLFVDDFVCAVEAALACDARFEIFNIGSGTSLSVAEVVQSVVAAVGPHVTVHSEGSRRQNEIMEVCADISKARALLSWEPQLTFEEGCRETIRSIQASMPTPGSGVA